MCRYDVTRLTKLERGRLNAATRELRAIQATPALVRAHAVRYRELYRDAVLTPQALAGNWQLTRTKADVDAHAPVETEETRRYRESLARQAATQKLHDEATTLRRLLDNPLPLKQGARDPNESTAAWHARVKAAWDDHNRKAQEAHHGEG